MSVKAPITKAFANLRKLGYFAKQNHTCCQSCGWAEIPDKQAAKAVFYHSQDNTYFKETGRLYLAWSGNYNEIVQTLESQGLNIINKGNEDQRILVSL